MLISRKPKAYHYEEYVGCSFQNFPSRISRIPNNIGTAEIRKNINRGKKPFEHKLFHPFGPLPTVPTIFKISNGKRFRVIYLFNNALLKTSIWPFLKSVNEFFFVFYKSSKLLGPIYA